MRRLVVVIFALGSILPAFAQHQHHAAPSSTAIQLEQGLGGHHHPVSTKIPEAQRFFDQGMSLLFGFNHEAAIKSFQRAAEIDPQSAMAHWGIALALGPNINMDVDPEREKAAHEAVQKARSLASSAPQHEKDYIEALARRYSPAPDADLKALAVDYKKAMGELVVKYPDDLDLATLYAESAMDLRPWQLWSADGKPAEGTEELVQVLESVLRRDPMHLGANHYYIHAVEASPNAERALPSAERLKSLAPAAGHLVHMPAHIFTRTGDYASAATSNAAALKADEAWFARYGSEGIYPIMYYNHNFHFLAAAHAMDGRLGDARQAAEAMKKNLGAVAKEMPFLEGVVEYPTLILVRFGRWDDVLAVPDGKYGPQSDALRRFARGVAYAAKGEVARAESEQKAFQAARGKVGPDDSYMLNKASVILDVADNVLAARIAGARGDQDQAIALFRKAVTIEDSTNYDEPSDWFYPVRESLGAALLRQGKAEEAEKVFREDLSRNARNGRSLLGLAEALKKQGKDAAAAMVQREFERAWSRADTKLRVEDL